MLCKQYYGDSCIGLEKNDWKCDKESDGHCIIWSNQLLENKKPRIQPNEPNNFGLFKNIATN